MAEGATIVSHLPVVELGMDRDGNPVTSGVVVPAEVEAVIELIVSTRKRVTSHENLGIKGD
jgi:hypothetical protein